MARMYPSNGPVQDTSSLGERELYQVLCTLPDEYRIIHSTPWRAPDKGGRMRQGEADYVIVHPRHGIIVLEVKGGEISVDGNTKQWYTTKLRGKQRGKKSKLPKDPFRQGSDSMYVLRDYFEQATTTQPFASELRLGYAAWFPDIDWKQKNITLLHATPELILDIHDKDHPEAGLLRVYQGMRGTSRLVDLPDDAIEAVIHLLSPTFTIRQSLATAIKGEETAIQQLTDAQMERLQEMAYHPQLATAGAAGTGKTVLALESAWRLAESGKRVLFLCVNPRLAEWLVQRVTQDAREHKPQFDVYALKSLCELITKLGGMGQQEVSSIRVRTRPGQLKLSSLLWDNVRAMERKGIPMPYDAIIVDEGEDIDQPLWMPLQKLLRDRANGYFYIFYDEAQRLDLPDKWRLRPIFPPTHFSLARNCRNTQAIWELMAEFRPELKQHKFEGPPGDPVRYIDPSSQASSITSVGDEVDLTLQNVLDELTGDEERVRPEDILVITGRTEEESRWYRSAERVVGRHTLRWLDQGRKGGMLPYL